MLLFVLLVAIMLKAFSDEQIHYFGFGMFRKMI